MWPKGDSEPSATADGAATTRQTAAKDTFGLSVVRLTFGRGPL
jgi:hypothetical protein